MSGFIRQFQDYRTFFEEELKKFCAGMRFEPSVLTESMRYSLLSGGKRIRPVLFFSALDILGEDYRKQTEFALALECIHTYSLIHDDLPAMDNDDFRRGNPSNHKVFGEANAILAGDGLLSLACSLLLQGAAGRERSLEAAQILSSAMGADGMVAGQSADLLYERKEAGEKELFFIYEHKTGKLIAAPVVMAATLAGKFRAEMEAFGNALGVLFQLTDDILDERGDSGKMGKTLGKDREEGKLTAVKLFGLDRAERLADRYAEECLSALGSFGEEANFLRELVALVREREN